MRRARRPNVPQRLHSSRSPRLGCTIEVVVDVAAEEVEIYGDTGTLRTLGGQPSQWRRLECTSHLPVNPTDFAFTGVHGRGRQALSADPRQNRGVAVIRIEDPKSGSEGYTFDIEWCGGSAPASPYQRPSDYSNLSANVVTGCQNAVRDRALRDYGFRDIYFGAVSADAAAGRSEWIQGTFDTGRGSRRASFRFSCRMDYRTGEARSVEVTRVAAGGPLGGVLSRPQAVRSCQDAATARAQDGYSDVRIRWADADSRPGRQDRVEGTASARGRDGYDTFLDFSCFVDFNNASVRSVIMRPR
jgi:hypothetical protein